MEEELRAILEDTGIDLEGPIDALLLELGIAHSPPPRAIITCLARIEEAGPALRTLVERAAGGEPLDELEAMQHFRGLHIMGGARSSEAFPALMRLLRRPIDEIDYLLGDAVTESLAKIAAGMFDGDAEALFDIIGDVSVDEFIRQALIGAATFLTWDGRIATERMRRFVETFYAPRSVPDWDASWVAWLEAIALLGWRDLAPLVDQAWDEGRIPEDMMDRADFESDLAEAERAPGDIERFRTANLGYIEDVLESLQWTDRGNEGLPDEDGFDPAYDIQQPYRNPLRDIGRNDPCPCGSGKKYKKCCLN